MTYLLVKVLLFSFKIIRDYVERQISQKVRDIKTSLSSSQKRDSHNYNLSTKQQFIEEST